MTDYGVLIDWDNNGYHAWDARPGDAPNLLGRGAANWTEKLSHRTNASAEIGADAYFSTKLNTGLSAIQTQGLYYVRWDTGASLPTGTGHVLYLGRRQDTIGVSPLIETYTLALDAATYKVQFKLRVSSGTATGVTLKAVGRASGTLATTTLGTISTTFATFSLTFTVGSAQAVSFEFAKTVSMTFSMDVIEPFLILSSQTFPTAFNCGTASLSENLTADVMEARWNVGAKEPWRYIGDENRLRLILTNRHDTYSLENPSSPLYRSYRLGPMPIYIVANADGAGWQRLYTGYIETIRPQPMQNGRQTAELTAGTVRRLLDKQELEIALYENIDSPDLLAHLLDFTNLVTVAPYLTKPQLVRFASAFSTTDTQYTLAGDQWPNGTRVLDAVGDVLQADFGKLWINRDGDAEYYLKLNYDAIFALTMDELDDSLMASADYEIVPARANLVSAYSYPRKVTPTDRILWQSDSDIDVEPGKTVEMTVRYTVEEDDVTVGGKNTYVDTFTVSGANVTYNWTDDDARGGTLKIISTAVNPRTVTAIIIKGKRITWFNARRQRARDNEAIGKWGKVTEVIENRLVEKLRVAERLADRAVAEFGEPRGVMKSIAFRLARTEAERAAFLTYKAGSFVRISEGQTHHSSRHMVIGEEHEFRNGLSEHHVKLYLEQLPRWLVMDDDEAGLLDAGYYLA